MADQQANMDVEDEGVDEDFEDYPEFIAMDEQGAPMIKLFDAGFWNSFGIDFDDEDLS
jgi:hypothetical protein